MTHHSDRLDATLATLRPLQPEDADGVLDAFQTDPEMSRQGDVVDVRSATGYIAALTEEDSGRHAFAVDVAGRVGGIVGLSVDPQNLTGWFFYWMHPRHRGTGLMGRAVRTVADWALSEGGLHRLELGHRRNNPASGGVARAGGFVQEGVEREKFLVEGHRVDVRTWGRVRTDPPASGDRLSWGVRPPPGYPRSMRITVVEGDITDQRVDAVVNAANSSLLGGGGVDGAIHAAAGPELLEHCRALRSSTWPEGLPPGRAAVTPGARLPAAHVIHTVGPNRRSGETDPDILAACFRSSLEQAVEIGARTVAFPAVGAGVFGWDAADVASAAHQVLTEDRARWATLQEVRFVLFSAEIAEAFRAQFDQFHQDRQSDDDA